MLNYELDRRKFECMKIRPLLYLLSTYIYIERTAEVSCTPGAYERSTEVQPDDPRCIDALQAKLGVSGEDHTSTHTYVPFYPYKRL